MARTTEALIDIGLDHLGRFAFFTRDNPFPLFARHARVPAERQTHADRAFRGLPISGRLEKD